MIFGVDHQVWFSAVSGVELIRLSESSNEQVRSLANGGTEPGKNE